MSVNRVILVGRLTKDPEQRSMPNGEAVTNASLATNESWKDKSGAKQEKVEYHNLTFYRGLAQVAGSHLKKGSMIYVEGKLATRKWQDKEGKDRYTTDIIVNEMQMLSSKPSGDQETDRPAPANSTKPAGTTSKPGAGGFDNFDDDIPF